MTGHRVEWFIDHDSVYCELICEEPEGAYCRRTCLEGCDGPCGHALADAGHCLAAEWIENDPCSLAEFYGGDDCRPLRDGPVDVTWDAREQNWLWHYPEPVLVPAAQRGNCANCQEPFDPDDPVVPESLGMICEDCAEDSL